MPRPIKLALLALVLASLAAGGRAYLSRDSPKSGADPAPARAAMPLRLITGAVRVGIKGVGIQGND